MPAELVAAAKMQERRQTEFQKNSIAGLASVWADALALYGLESPEADLARIEKVTVADVNRVAHQYLNLDQAVTRGDAAEGLRQTRQRRRRWLWRSGEHLTG